MSFHSVSKGVIGECGRRGGFFELHNVDPAVSEQVSISWAVSFLLKGTFRTAKNFFTCVLIVLCVCMCVLLVQSSL
jgi:hypothetical protein